MWPLAAGLPRKTPEPKPVTDVSDLAAIYRHVAASPGICDGCKQKYGPGQDVVTTGTRPEGRPEVLCMSCFNEREAA